MTKRHDGALESGAEEDELFLDNVRRDTDPIQRAEAVQRIIDRDVGPGRKYSTVDAFARARGKSPSTISGILSFLRLKGEARAAVREGRIGRHVGEDIAQTTNDEREQALLAALLSGVDHRSARRILSTVRARPGLLREARTTQDLVAVIQEATPSSTTSGTGAAARPRADEAAARESLRRAEAGTPPAPLRHIAPRAARGVHVTLDHEVEVHTHHGALSFSLEELGLDDCVLVPRTALGKKAVKEPVWTEALLRRVTSAARSREQARARRDGA